MKTYFLNNHISESGYAFLLNKRNQSTLIYAHLESHIQNCTECHFQYNELNDMMNEYFETPNERSFSLNSVLKIAAIFIICYASWTLYTSKTNTSNYIINTKLEQLIGDNLRSNQIISTPSIQFKAKAKFSFDKEVKNITVIFLSNTGEHILTKSPTNGEITVLKEELGTGLFYWKIETPDELLKVGKLIINN